MGEMKTEDMPLPSLFDEASKIHVKATESGSSDQVQHFLISVFRKVCNFFFFNLGFDLIIGFLLIRFDFDRNW